MAARTRRGRAPRNRVENLAHDEASAANGAGGGREQRKAKRKKGKKKDGKRSELDVLREQAARARRRFPKLFKFLAKRDEATFDLVRGVLDGEPVKVKFVNEALHAGVFRFRTDVPAVATFLEGDLFLPGQGDEVAVVILLKADGLPARQPARVQLHHLLVGNPGLGRRAFRKRRPAKEHVHCLVWRLGLDGTIARPVLGHQFAAVAMRVVGTA